MLIPPPPKLQSFRDEDDVERRLQSLLDVAEEDQPGMESKPKDLSSMKELDRIGYVVCYKFVKEASTWLSSSFR